MLASLSTGSTIKALGRSTGQCGHLTCSTAVSLLALTAERPLGVEAETAVKTHARFSALVNIVATVLSLVARRAGTVVMVVHTGTASPVGTWTCGTGVDVTAVLSWNLIRIYGQFLIRLLCHSSCLGCSVASLLILTMCGRCAVPLKPLWQTQEYCGIPFITWLLHAPPFRHGDRWQGSRCWQRGPMKPGRHLGVGGIHTQIRTSTILTQIKTANVSKIKQKNRDNPSDTYPTSLTWPMSWHKFVCAGITFLSKEFSDAWHAHKQYNHKQKQQVDGDWSLGSYNVSRLERPILFFAPLLCFPHNISGFCSLKNTPSKNACSANSCAHGRNKN